MTTVIAAHLAVTFLEGPKFLEVTGPCLWRRSLRHTVFIALLSHHEDIHNYHMRPPHKYYASLWFMYAGSHMDTFWGVKRAPITNIDRPLSPSAKKILAKNYVIQEGVTAAWSICGDAFIIACITFSIDKELYSLTWGSFLANYMQFSILKARRDEVSAV